MHFFVDESGHTGANLFDETQPVLYYGVLSSKANLDVVAEARLAPLRKRLGVERLHAAELGVGRLSEIASHLVRLQKDHDLRFDMYRVFKSDHALICFFDQVFDQGVNGAVPWTTYWTPMRYVMLFKLAGLFDEHLLRKAWEARITFKDEASYKLLSEICDALL